jgi:hypothetical protein
VIHSLLLARKDDEFPSDYRFLDERFFPRELDELDEESLPLDDDELDEESLPLDDDELDEYDDELVELPLVLPLLDELDDDPDEELELLDRRLFRRFFFSPNAALNRRSSTPAPSGTSSNCSSANFCLFAGSRIRSVALARRTYFPLAAALVRPHARPQTPLAPRPRARVRVSRALVLIQDEHHRAAPRRASSTSDDVEASLRVTSRRAVRPTRRPHGGFTPSARREHAGTARGARTRVHRVARRAVRERAARRGRRARESRDGCDG